MVLGWVGLGGGSGGAGLVLLAEVSASGWWVVPLWGGLVWVVRVVAGGGSREVSASGGPLTFAS